MTLILRVVVSVYMLIFSLTTYAEEKGLNLNDVQFQRESVVQSGDVYKVIVVLLIMLALAAAILYILKIKLGIKQSKDDSSAEGEKISIIDNKRIAPHATVTLLEIGNEKVVVAINKENIAMTQLCGVNAKQTLSDDKSLLSAENSHQNVSKKIDDAVMNQINKA